ncbi:prolow-density lipoprotein receptor-related protein 1-like [Mercenaria mercenaria]|uniref:prolow-density lipoprotein receptor-related protein 1-like n=1 Tax=Mercenaria mercenaria TaxID=6596 RepID=UPI00234EA3F2|nr:prolow-density lipoprotein receptor-related protein 1-like [Mercenaria mercenaria]XP_053402383.1 prolow-density lipoprotein receptor-related protein 1-like [Mercenaria mercenaria]XP_053402384.1 prolow-density lipoprotein receptor-related protein 1-like [Mercenaria mercenaria]
MGRSVCALLLLGLYAWCYGQSPTPAPLFDYEHGMLVTTFHDYGDPDAAQIRHIPIYLGYENFSGGVPGIGFTNPNIHFLSVDFDYRSKCIYMYDYHLRSIALGCGFNVKLNVSQMDFAFMHVGVSRGTVQIAVDWLSHTVYWTDSVFRWIVAAPGQKDKIDMDYYKIIEDKHLDAPDGLGIDPLEGLLFWTDNGKHPKIERATTMGGDRHTIIPNRNQKSPLVSPLSMEVDIKEKRIFWIDSSTEAILSADYEGQDIIEIRKVPGSTLLDIGIFRECVYVTDTRNGDVITLNKTDGPHLGKLESTTVNISPETIYGIAVYGPDNQPTKATDACADKKCEHLCLTTKTGAECVCSEGYHLNSTGKCQASYDDYHKAIVASNATHICLVDLRTFAHMNYDVVCKYTAIKPNKIPTTAPTTTPAPTPAASTGMTSAPNATTTPNTTTPTIPPPTAAPDDLIKIIEMDMENRIFFFATANNVIYKRPIDMPIENDAKDAIAYPSGNISGLAFDPINKNNLYWCESNTGQIWVINVRDNAARNILDNLEVKNVKNLMVMLDERRLAMIAGEEGDMSIITMTLDGTDSQTVVSGISSIPAFVYDRERKLFYYINGGYVYSVMFDGTQKKTLFNGVDKNAFHLVLYKNYLTWIFSTSTYKHLVRTHNLLTKQRVALGYFDNSTLVDLKVLDVNLQTSNVTNPCAYENGNCEQLCITHYTAGKMTKLCECRMAYRLADDGTSCISTVTDDDFLLVSDWTNEALFQIDLKTDKINAIPKEQNDEFMGVYFDSDTKKVIWAEYYSSEINSANLNGTDFKILADLGYEGYAYRFAKDYTTKNLYFSAYYDTFIGVLTPSGGFLRLEYDFGYDDLGDIVVHPGKGWMYFTVTGWTKSYIGRADMDGGNVVEIITGDHVDYPDGLAIDYINDHLYWSDATYDTIQRCDLNGKKCTTIINMTSTYRDEEIRDLVTDGKYLYYSAYKKDHVIRVDLKTLNRTVVGRNPGLGKLDTLALYSSKDKNIQPVGTGCKDRNGLGDCSTVCYPTPTGRTCACQKGVSLKSDGRTCTDIYQCTDLIKQEVTLITNIKKNVSIEFDDSCLRHLGDKCKYKCEVNFVPIFDEPLKCTGAGWDKESDFTPLCRERRCPATIQNGVLDNSCEREIGEKCNFKCNEGFKKRRTFAVCTTDETYHLPDEELCEPFLCNETIANGKLEANCERTVGTSCKYSCNKFYTPSDKKAQAMCTSNGWKPSDTDMCKESVCDDTSLSNGQVNENCMKKIGEACTYRCNQGFVNTTYMAVCKNDRSWHPAGSCKVAKCPSTIPNGNILDPCDFAIGSECNFVCSRGFAASDKLKNLMCNSAGQWSAKGSICLESVISPEKQTQKESLSKPGVIVGVIVLVLIIIALVAAIIVLFRRNMGKSASHYSSASFHKDASGIQIENPGYRPNNDNESNRQKDEHPYSSVDPSQMQPVSFSGMEASGGGGIANPLYDKEPLPEVTHVDLNEDKTVLTYDSWLKEREKNKNIA